MRRVVAAFGLHGRLVALRLRRSAVHVLIASLGLATLQPADAQPAPVKGEIAASDGGGYTRLIVKLDEDVDTEASVAGSVLVVRFRKPVSLVLERAIGPTIGASRRDPDGLAVRFSLNRRVGLNVQSAGERTFIDLLPETWSGPPPGLPPEVVKELADRARAAERTLRAQREAETAPKGAPRIRVRASVQPTFTRFSFEIPDSVAADASLGERALKVTFAAPVTLDLADARVVAPPIVAGMATQVEGDGTVFDVALLDTTELRSFREDGTFIVDLVNPRAQRPASPLVTPAVPQPAKAKASVEAPQALVIGDIARPPSPVVQEEAMSQPRPTVASPAPKAVPVAQTPNENARMIRVGDGVRFVLPNAAKTPAALFRRGDAYWLVLDDAIAVDTARLRTEAGATLGEITTLALPQGQAIRFRLTRPQLASVTADDGALNVTFSDVATTSSQPLQAMRNIVDPARASVLVPMTGAGRLYRLSESDIGEPLAVVTATVPARGFLRRQDFVEFAFDESVQGVVLQAFAEDIAIDVTPERIVLTRPGGLTLSAAVGGKSRATAAMRPLFDLREWRANRETPFRERLETLTAALSRVPEGQRMSARSDIARFYFANGFYLEARATLDAMMRMSPTDPDDPAVLIMHAVANALSQRPDEALKELGDPLVGTNYDSQVWKGLALAGQGKWPEARDKFKNAAFAINVLPLELQRAVLARATLASIEVKDFADAAGRLSEWELLGVPEDDKPTFAVLRGRVSQALGRDDDALADFRAAAMSDDRSAAAQGRLFEIMLRTKRQDLSAADAMRDLEILAATWRGDGVELKTLQLLTKQYAAAGRFADALVTSRAATQLKGNSDIARELQDVASDTFAQLFLTTKGDALPPVEALTIFYENRDLVPIGRRGDELIRRLADRLVTVDLLEQAAELLQYQVDKRLEGAARAQVAARLATVYLMNRKPDRAIAALRTTRMADLAGELRQQRLLLEARAQADVGRRDLALDIIANVGGREAVRLRSDIYWAGRKWREAAEQIELYLGERWRDFTPLEAGEKSDVVRATIGYALGDDALGLSRFREKFAPLMAGTSDRTAFEIASRPSAASGVELAQIAKIAASVDTLDGFLKDMKARFGDQQARAKADVETTGSVRSDPRTPMKENAPPARRVAR